MSYQQLIWVEMQRCQKLYGMKPGLFYLDFSDRQKGDHGIIFLYTYVIFRLILICYLYSATFSGMFHHFFSVVVAFWI